MDIGFVSFEYPPHIAGGAGIYARGLTAKLVDLGHNVTVFTPKRSGGTKYTHPGTHVPESLDIVSLDVSSIIPFQSLAFSLSILNNRRLFEGFDIIHLNGYSYWLPQYRLSRVPHILTVHHSVRDATGQNNLSLFERIRKFRTENNPLMYFVEKNCIENVDHIISVSEFTRDSINELYNISPDENTVVYNGISEQEIQRASINPDRTGNGGEENRIVFLFVGRVDDKRKGLDLLLEAIARLPPNLSWKLLIVGGGNQTMAKKKANQLDISEMLEFKGFVSRDELYKYYNICDVYINPSRLEGFGLTIIEAIASGTPVIATRVGAIPEVASKNTGVSLTDPNPKDLSDEILNIIYGDLPNTELNPTFTFGQTAKQTTNIYKQVTNEW